jgi:hypothetical protein
MDDEADAHGPRPTPANRSLARGLLAGVVALLLLVLFFFLFLSRERTIAIEARTLGGEITFSASTNHWLLSPSVLCRPREAPDFRAAAPPDASSDACSPVFYQIDTADQRVIDWQSGMSIRFSIDSIGNLVLEVTHSSVAQLPSGSVLFIAAEDWARHGALAFIGQMTVGEPLATGARNYTLDGRWQMRQSGRAVSLFRDITDVVKTGDLTRGAAVRIVGIDGEPATVYGALTPIEGDDEGGIAVTALSHEGDVALELSYFGLEAPSLLKPDWIDTLLSSPVILALVTVLLPIILVVAQLFVALVSKSQGISVPWGPPLLRRFRRHKIWHRG